jgi:hypothetical protein
LNLDLRVTDVSALLDFADGGDLFKTASKALSSDLLPMAAGIPWDELSGAVCATLADSALAKLPKFVQRMTECGVTVTNLTFLSLDASSALASVLRSKAAKEESDKLARERASFERDETAAIQEGQIASARGALAVEKERAAQEEGVADLKVERRRARVEKEQELTRMEKDFEVEMGKKAFEVSDGREQTKNEETVKFLKELKALDVDLTALLEGGENAASKMVRAAPAIEALAEQMVKRGFWSGPEEAGGRNGGFEFVNSARK